jgi:hypothetical protein
MMCKTFKVNKFSKFYRGRVRETVKPFDSKAAKNYEYGMALTM